MFFVLMCQNKYTTRSKICLVALLLYKYHAEFSSRHGFVAAFCPQIDWTVTWRNAYFKHSVLFLPCLKQPLGYIFMFLPGHLLLRRRRLWYPKALLLHHFAGSGLRLLALRYFGLLFHQILPRALEGN